MTNSPDNSPEDDQLYNPDFTPNSEVAQDVPDVPDSEDEE